MNRIRRIHKQKNLQRVRDLQAQARGRRLAQGFCLAKSAKSAAVKAPLDLSHVELPASYED